MIKFIKEPDPDNPFDVNRIEYECNDIGWPDILESFKDFLEGCGFRGVKDDEEENNN